MINSLKKHLCDNVKDLEKVLLYFKYKNINITHNEVRCAKPDGENETTVRIRLNEYLSSNDFSLAFKGDIFGLIQTHTKLDFSSIFEVIKLIVNKKLTHEEESHDEIFDGFFDDIYVPYDVDMKPYNSKYLDTYKPIWNTKFLNDNISMRTQLKFNIGYDDETNRITIPWRNEQGELLGIMGRYNGDEYGKYKYLPILPFPKQYSLYGVYENKEYIKNNRCYIGESEKFVLQLHSYGYKNAVALGGNAIHSYQIEQLLKLNVQEIVLCYDEGLEKEVIKNAILTIKESLFMRDDIRIGVIYDKNNEYMCKDSKVSPSDLGKLVWEDIINNCIKFSN